MVGLSLLGYVKVMLFIRRITFVRDFTPSRGPGTGKVKAMVSLLSSKYAFFSGCLSTNWVRHLPFSPLKVFSFRSWKSMMCVHILSRKGVKCDVQMMLPLKLSSQSSNQAMLSTSKWPVGSSSMSTSAFMSCAAQSCIFIFQPPEYEVTGFSKLAARSGPPGYPKPIDFMSSFTSSSFTGVSSLYTSLQVCITHHHPGLSTLRIGNPSSCTPTSSSSISCSTKTLFSSSRFGKPSSCSFAIARISVLFPDLLLRFRGHLHLRPDTLNHSGEGILGAHVSLPCCRIEVPHVRRRGRKSSHVGGLLAVGLVPEALLQDLQSLLLLDHDLVARSLRGLLQSVVRPLRDAPGLGVRHLLHRRLHQRLQLRHQRLDLTGVLDHFAHVVHDLAASPTDLLRLVVEATGEHWHHHRERRGLHVLHEDAARETLYAGVSVRDRGGRVDHGGQERLQILVPGARGDRRHARKGSLLHLLLDVAGQVRHRGDQVRELVANGPRGLLRERRDDVQSRLLLRGLRLHAQPGEEGRKQQGEREGAGHLHDRIRRRGRGVPGLLVLVPHRLTDRAHR